jgi:DNA-binding winged helix-turn-helix (wHTH) protein/tetratricopeptide (TPR) repeat protein
MPAETPLSNDSSRGVRYRFGLFELSVEHGKLVRDGKAIRLQEQPLQLLAALVERAGEVVTREEIRQRLWPGDTFVDFDKSLGVAVTKLRDALGDDAGNPTFIETLPRRGYRFIAPVERRVEPSVQTASALAEAATPTPAEVVGPNGTADFGGAAGRRSSWKVWWWALAAAVVALAAGYGIRHYGGWRAQRTGNATGTPPAPAAVSTTALRRSVAILGFRNLPGKTEDAWLSAAFSEMLNTELAAGGALRLVAGEDVARAKRELPLGDGDTLGKPTLQRLHTNPGADLVVLGSYSIVRKDGKKVIRLDLRLQDTGSGETVAEDSLVGTEDELFDIAGRAGGNLRKAMGISSASADQSSAARASLPVNPKAVKLYTAGREKLWNFDYQGAEELLIKAVATEPSYPLAHAALSEAYWHRGFNAKSRAEAQRAVELSGHLSEEDRLLVESEYRRAVEDWPKAVAACLALHKLFPDRLDYGLLLASAQSHENTEDALRTIAELHRLPLPLGDDPRIDTLEATALINANMVQARAAAKLAIAKGTEQGSHELVARAYATLCQQGPSTSTSEAEAIADCEGALQMSKAAGDNNGVAMALNNLAAIYFAQGDLARAEETFRKTVEQFRAIGNPEGMAAGLGNLGGVLLSRGDLRQAKKYFEEAIPNQEAVNDIEGVALTLNNLGDLAEQSGDLEVAKIEYDRGMVTAQRIDSKGAEAYVMFGEGNVLYDRGEMEAARKSYEGSLAIRQKLGVKQGIAETETAMALVQIEEHAAADAELTLRRCRDEFHQEHQADDELLASTELIYALLAQGKLAEAQQEVERTAALAKSSQNRLSQLQYVLAGARASVASAQPEAAREPIERVLNAAHASGYVGLELEAQLARAELEKKVGHAAAAQAQLTTVKSLARAKGFGRVATRAGEELGR